MGFFSLHETCSCCGGDTGFNKVKCKDGYLCQKCLKLFRTYDKTSFILKITGPEINSMIGNHSKCARCGSNVEQNFKKIRNVIYCRSCYDKIKFQEKEDKKNEYIQSQKKAQNFVSTSNVGKYIYFNDDIEEIYVPNFWSGPFFIKYSEILDFELLEDGTTVSSGGVGRAVAGGVLFGGAGAVVGAVTGKHKGTNIANSMEIRITTKDINNPVVFIKIFKGEHKKGSFIYNAYRDEAYKILSMLQIIVDRVNKTQQSNEQNSVSNNNLSVVEELKGLKELLDSGILTQEEFEKQKSKILNR